MDLPICPHCGQSVLDDDVDECPFCGESMSAKPTGKKPTPAKPGPVPQATKSAPAEAKSAPARPAKAKPKSSENVPSADQPFAVDHAALTNAVPLRPSPSPGRTYQVVCPMCETPGYTSPKAGGREVKCANPKCLVPIFTCPEPPPAPVEEAPPEPASMSTTQLGLISVVALAVIGWGIWFFVLKNDDPSPNVPPAEMAGNAGNETEKTQPENLPEQPQDVVPPTPQGPTLAEQRPIVVEKMVEASRVPSVRGKNRPMALRVQSLALAYAELGDLKNAETQIEQLANYNDDEPHYRVLPWVEIGWKLREREESAKEAADKALESAKKEPASLYDSWKDAVSLSALLTALGRSEETAPLMARKLGAALDQELWADMMAVSLMESFNLEAREQTRPLTTPANPAWTGVVWQLVFHDASQEALDWANRATDLRTRAESLIAWADATSAKSLAEKAPLDLAALDAAIKTLPEAWPAVVTARAYARMGQRHVMASDQAQAKTLLDTAAKALASLPKSEAMPVPDLEGIYRAKFSGANVGHEIAIAAFEVARLQTALNQTDAAWSSIEQGLAALRSEGLPLAAVRLMQSEVKSSAAALQAELRAALNLGSEDATRQAFQAYQKNVNEFDRRAQSRMQLQTDLLAHAARWGLAEKVAAEILRASEEEAGDSYVENELPWIVLAELKGKKPELASEIDAKLKARRRTKPKKLALLESSAQAMDKLDVPMVLQTLGRGTRENDAIPESERKRWLLRLCTRQVLKGETGPMLSFLLGLFNVDPFLGEDAAELIIALATENGQGELVLRELEQRSFQPTQKLAGYRGFLAAVDPAAEEVKN